ncbi:MAG: oligoribonuclease [Propionibacteriaceae bacterium]|nr:oligoribonuclease [Propionibacteriaceae bacterium]
MRAKVSCVENLVWIDCEMTGLDLSRDALIEVAVLVTDANLSVLGDGVDVLIAPPPGALDHMSDVVTQMHSASGLIDVVSSGMTLAEAEEQVMAYVRAHVSEPDKAPLAGNSIGTDRAFLARDMPTLEGYLHYRNIDVSSIKELVRRWYPRTFFSAPEKHGNHRALGDIQDSINELRYYRETVFVPEPGLTREEARRIAGRYAAPFSATPHGRPANQ